MPGAPPALLGSGLLLAVAGSVAFSAKAIIVKLAYRHGVDAVTLLMYRMLLALPLFLVMAWWAGRDQPPLRSPEWLRIAGLGFCGYYLASFLDFWGLQYISASLERLILYLNPTLVLLLGWGLYGRRISGRQALGMCISYAGVLLVFGQEASLEGRDVGLGSALVLGSAVCYAVYLSYSGQWVQRLGSLRLAGWASSVASVLCIGQFLLLRPLAAAQVAEPVLWLSLLNAVMCTAVPVLLVMMAIERIGPALASQVGMVGPMSTLLLGVLVLGESFNSSVLLGTALVLGGVFWVTRQARV